MRTFAQIARSPAAKATRPPAVARPPARDLSVRSVLRGPVQPKLRIGAVNDPAEAEADRIAEQVMRMPEPDTKAVSPEPTEPAASGPVRRSEGILGIPGTGGRCCHDSPDGPEWALVGDPSDWRQLSNGDCTDFSEDCDGMTCGGGFYKVSDLMRGTCRTPGEDDWFFSSRRWTPNSRGEDAQSPIERGGQSDTPPGYVYRSALHPETLSRMQADEEEDIQRSPTDDVVHRKCAECEAEEQGLDTVRRKCAACDADEQAQRKPAGTARPKETASKAPAMTPVGETAIWSLGGGTPLPTSERSFFEPRFGRDLSAVRVHTGARANEASNAINARAFALGSNIAFAGGEYRPGTSQGRRLMAHELAHVGQQSAGHANVARRARVTLSHANCRDPGDMRKIAEGIAGGLAMAHTATLWFLSPNPRDRRRVDALLDPIFMSTSQDVYEAVRDRVIATAAVLRRAAAGNITFICAPSSDTECGSRSGYVRTNRRGEVNICEAFFDLGLEERKWMIMHEAAHLAGAIGPELYYADFGTVDCSIRTNQVSSTQTALQNADSFARLIWCLTRPSNTVLRPVPTP